MGHILANTILVASRKTAGVAPLQVISHYYMKPKQFKDTISLAFPEAVFHTEDRLPGLILSTFTQNGSILTLALKDTECAVLGIFVPDPTYRFPLIKFNRVDRLKTILNSMAGYEFKSSKRPFSTYMWLIPVAAWMDEVDPEDTPPNDLVWIASDYFAKFPYG